jgi:ketosteroid isomerase-like protein
VSQENVEIVRQGWDAFARGDLDALMALHAEDVVFDMSHLGDDWPERTYTGHLGVQRFVTDWLEVWSEVEIGVDEFVAAPDGRVVVLFWQRALGRRSGLPMEVEWAQIATVRGDKYARLSFYEDRQEALKAVALEE